jgi:site-specific DNA-methyltransferase (adenine-specific)
MQTAAANTRPATGKRARLRIVLGDNIKILPTIANGAARLIYIDPPFNTGKKQERVSIRTVEDTQGDRVGFGGKRYKTTTAGKSGYADSFGDGFLEFLQPRLREAHRILAADGSLFFHIDYREVHYCKILLDQIFGRESFMNEIIWAYDFGARSKSRWPPKHDNILWYAKNPRDYVFNYEQMDRIPYMAPALAGAKKAARGKTPTDVWWHTIVPTNGREKTGYATQKPLGLLERIVKIHSHAGDTLMDFFAGSGTFGEAAANNNRHCILIDQNPQAAKTMAKRLARHNPALQDATTVL